MRSKTRRSTSHSHIHSTILWLLSVFVCSVDDAHPHVTHTFFSRSIREAQARAQPVRLAHETHAHR